MAQQAQRNTWPSTHYSKRHMSHMASFSTNSQFEDIYELLCVVLKLHVFFSIPKDKSGLVMLRFPSHSQTWSWRWISSGLNYEAWNVKNVSVKCQEYSHFEPIWSRTIDRLFMNVSFSVTTSVSLRSPVTGFTGNQSCLTKSRCGPA